MSNEIFDDLEDFDEKQVEQMKPTNIQEFNSTLTFQEMDLDIVLLEALKKAQFENPSPVQSLTIPKVLLERDVLCQAKSGTGKTAVFVLGILQILLRYSDRVYIIIAHTNELVDQITTEFYRFSVGLNFIIKTFSENISENEESIIRRKIDFNILVVPINKTYVLMQIYDLKGVTGIVVDECDAILGNEGMTKKFERLRGCLKKEGVHIMMYTATLSLRAKNICLNYLKEPFIVVVDDDSKLKLTRLRQYYININERNKLSCLQKLVNKNNCEKKKDNNSSFDNICNLNNYLGDFHQIIVFCKEPQNVLYIEQNFESVCGITSYMSIEERANRLNEFKERKFRILSTTDMLSRGIDIQAVDCVINYDMPKDPQTYLHRIARAGRFDTTGTAISFINGHVDEVRMNEVLDLYEIEIKNLKDLNKVN